MKRISIVLLLPMLFAVGCGVNKDYVSEQIAASEARTSTEITGVSDKVEQNAAEVQRLTELASELESRTEMALNEAAGFENYQIIWSGEINFEFDSFDLTATAQDYLNEAGTRLESSPKALIEIIGHTDATGSANYNFFLGQKRANSVKRFLADSFGISLYRMFILSYGENKPMAMPDDRQASTMNRRVEIKIWGPMM